MKIKANEYANLVNTRLNHVQNLQSAISGLLGIFCIALLITIFTLLRDTGTETTKLFKLPESIQPVSLLLTTVILSWLHVFSLYQVFSVVKCVKILTNIESDVEDYSGLKYFEANNKRLVFYAIAHSFPSIILLFYPFMLYRLHILTYPCLWIATIVIIVLTVVVIIFFKFAFFPRKITGTQPT